LKLGASPAGLFVEVLVQFLGWASNENPYLLLLAEWSMLSVSNRSVVG
jgi:hypothetical protein